MQYLIITFIADNQVKAGECGAIEVITNFMRVHINDADTICEKGCSALNSITLNNGRKQVIYNSNIYPKSQLITK